MEEEFDESEVLWGCTEEEEAAAAAAAEGSKKRRRRSHDGPKLEKDEQQMVVSTGSRSPPVKVLSTEMDKRGRNSEHHADGDQVIPPHEYLWRQRQMNGVVSFSVHEGVGRTLKGRDLSRVRNAVWAKIGFQD